MKQLIFLSVFIINVKAALQEEIKKGRMKDIENKGVFELANENGLPNINSPNLQQRNTSLKKEVFCTITDDQNSSNRTIPEENCQSTVENQKNSNVLFTTVSIVKNNLNSLFNSIGEYLNNIQTSLFRFLTVNDTFFNTGRRIKFFNTMYRMTQPDHALFTEFAGLIQNLLEIIEIVVIYPKVLILSYSEVELIQIEGSYFLKIVFKTEKISKEQIRLSSSMVNVMMDYRKKHLLDKEELSDPISDKNSQKKDKRQNSFVNFFSNNRPIHSKTKGNLRRFEIVRIDSGPTQQKNDLAEFNEAVMHKQGENITKIEETRKITQYEIDSINKEMQMLIIERGIDLTKEEEDIKSDHEMNEVEFSKFLKIQSDERDKTFIKKEKNNEISLKSNEESKLKKSIYQEKNKCLLRYKSPNNTNNDDLSMNYDVFAAVEGESCLISDTIIEYSESSENIDNENIQSPSEDPYNSNIKDESFLLSKKNYGIVNQKKENHQKNCDDSFSRWMRSEYKCPNIGEENSILVSNKTEQNDKIGPFIDTTEVKSSIEKPNTKTEFYAHETKNNHSNNPLLQKNENDIKACIVREQSVCVNRSDESTALETTSIDENSFTHSDNVKGSKTLSTPLKHLKVIDFLVFYLSKFSNKKISKNGRTIVKFISDLDRKTKYSELVAKLKPKAIKLADSWIRNQITSEKRTVKDIEISFDDKTLLNGGFEIILSLSMCQTIS